MSASLIVGLPRHGKSLYGVMQAKAELLDGKRYLVTNLPFDLKKLGEYLETKFNVTVEPQLFDRVRLLTPEETAEFWLYDCEGEIDQAVPLVKVKSRAWRSKRLKEREDILVPDFSHRQRNEYPGVLFLIDEAHLFFDAHHWQEIGTDLSYFVSQHGHMRTDIMLITQHPAKLAKRLKLDLEEWTVVENLGRKKGWLGVTQPGWFQRATYAGKPDDPDPGQPEKGTFRMEKALADCYSTSAGVGLSGRVDTQEQKRGKHWSRWALVGVALAVIALILPFGLLTAMGKAINWGLGGYMRSATGIGGRVVTNVVSATPAAPIAAPVKPETLPTHPPALKSEKPSLKVTGCSPWGLALSDGRVLSKLDGWRWQQLPDGVYVEGLGLLRFALSSPAPATPAQTPAFAANRVKANL